MESSRRAHDRHGHRSKEATRPRPRLAGALLSLRLLTVTGLAAILVSVPIGGLDGATEVDASMATRPLAAVAAGADVGFALDRDGHVVRVGDDGSLQQVASIGRHSTPFGTAVGGRVLFGGIRCDGSRCGSRVAEVTILDDGEVMASVTLRRSQGEPPALDGLALVGSDEETVWINGGGTLFQVAVEPAQVVAEVPWLGGEPCLIDGVLYDLVASGGNYGQQGAELASTATFQLRLQAWDGDTWRPITGGAASMAYGQNAYCSPDGYEIRDSGVTSRRWEPGTGWQAVARTGNEWTPDPGSLAPVTSSTHTRYVVGVDGSLLDITGGGPPQPTGVVIPGFATSDMPPAVQLDDAGGRLFWCATTYQAGAGVTSCAGVPDEQHRPMEDEQPTSPSQASAPPSFVPHRSDLQAVSSAPAPPEAHHYNLCSAACGGGVRPHSRDLVAWFVDRHRPMALSLNEQCYDDSVHLNGRMPPGFEVGASYVALDTATNCPGAVKQFGNQVRVRSDGSGSTVGAGPVPGSAWWTQFPTQTDMRCDHREQECRGMACIEGPGAGQPMAFCSAHLESARRGPSVPGAQADEYLELVAHRYRSHAARVLAGDFNLEQPDADIRLATGGYRSVVVGPTVNSHRPGASKQIDMIYYDGPGPTFGSTGRTYCDTQASDHCYVIASPNQNG